MSSKNLSRGMVAVFAANMLNLALSLIRNFILPKYLSIPVYADLKTFQLYTSYAGLFAMGYVDGMYLKYGGKDIQKIDMDKFELNLSTFRVFQFSVMIILLIIGFCIRDYIFIMMAFTIAFLNLIDYFKCFFQAVGEFSAYSRIMNVSSTLIFFINIILLFVFKAETAAPYLCGYTAVYALVWFVLECISRKNTNHHVNMLSFSKAEFSSTIKSGFLLMFGLLLSNFMVSMDRWFVKFTLDTTAFAQYSFAASILGFLAYAVSPIAITLYNYFCKNEEMENIIIIRGGILIFSAVIVACAFPVKFILEVYLHKYYESNVVMIILFGSQIIYSLIKCYYINLYKSSKKQRYFFKKMLVVLAAGFVLNVCLFAVFRNSTAFAIGTLLSSVVWLILCMQDFPAYRITFKEMLFLIITVFTFIMAGLMCRAVVGCLVYLGIVLLASAILMQQQTRFGLSYIRRIIGIWK